MPMWIAGGLLAGRLPRLFRPGISGWACMAWVYGLALLFAYFGSNFHVLALLLPIARAITALAGLND